MTEVGAKYFPNGLTVKELKELIKDWPETDEFGDPTVVTISGNEFIDERVLSVWPVSVRTDDNGNNVYSLSLDSNYSE